MTDKRTDGENYASQDHASIAARAVKMREQCPTSICRQSTSSSSKTGSNRGCRFRFHPTDGTYESQLIFTARRYANAVLAVIVCLSVCLSVCPSVSPSVTSQSCTKMAKLRITLTTPYDSPGNLAFRRQKSRRNSNDITPQRGRQIEVG